MLLLLVLSCADGPIIPADGRITKGTWGGENAGVIVEDTVAHVHVGCTFGYFTAPVTVDADGRFSVLGSYVLRAYPVFIGPYHPAEFSGTLDGDRLTISVIVNDTIEKKTVMRISAR